MLENLPLLLKLQFLNVQNLYNSVFINGTLLMQWFLYVIFTLRNLLIQWFSTVLKSSKIAFSVSFSDIFMLWVRVIKFWLSINFGCINLMGVIINNASILNMILIFSKQMLWTGWTAHFRNLSVYKGAFQFSYLKWSKSNKINLSNSSNPGYTDCCFK